MKKLFIGILLLFCSMGLLAQSSVRTENASNKHKRYTLPTPGDSISLAYTYNGTTYYGGNFVGLIFGQITASDTIIVMQGKDTLYNTIVAGSQVLPSPPILFNAHLDSAYLIFYKKKTSDVTLLYRKIY